MWFSSKVLTVELPAPIVLSYNGLKKTALNQSTILTPALVQVYCTRLLSLLWLKSTWLMHCKRASFNLFTGIFVTLSFLKDTWESHPTNPVKDALASSYRLAPRCHLLPIQTFLMLVFQEKLVLSPEIPQLFSDHLVALRLLYSIHHCQATVETIRKSFHLQTMLWIHCLKVLS